MDKKKLSGLELSISEFLSELGEDTSRDGLIETPQRFSKQLRECLRGYGEDPKQHLKLFEGNDFHDLVTVSRIFFSSTCEHHLLPFFGYIDIGYLPSNKILGLSKFARITKVFSKRLQVQERLTQELADFLEEHLQPKLTMVNISATHTCMSIRGAQCPESLTKTLVMRGNHKENQQYVEYFQRCLSRYDH